MRWTTVKRMPRKSRFDASACVSSRTTLRVLLLARERVHRGAEAELPADARDELDRLERLADEVVGAGLEGLRDLVLAVERGEHDHGEVARLGPRAQDAQDLVAVRRAASRDRAGRSTDGPSRSARAPRRPIPRRRARASRSRALARGHGATDHVIVDDQDGPAAHSVKCIGPCTPQATESPRYVVLAGQAVTCACRFHPRGDPGIEARAVASPSSTSRVASGGLVLLRAAVVARDEHVDRRHDEEREERADASCRRRARCRSSCARRRRGRVTSVSGKWPATVATVVMRIGRRRVVAAARTASSFDSPAPAARSRTRR